MTRERLDELELLIVDIGGNCESMHANKSYGGLRALITIARLGLEAKPVLEQLRIAGGGDGEVFKELFEKARKHPAYWTEAYALEKEHRQEIEAELAEARLDKEKAIESLEHVFSKERQSWKQIVARLKAELPKCANCGAAATCFGRYEGPEQPVAFACDECCGHGNEDGWCCPISNLAEHLETTGRELHWTEQQNDEVREQLKQSEIELAKAQLDKDRLDWLDGKRKWWAPHRHVDGYEPISRQAIDAAMKKETSNE